MTSTLSVRGEEERGVREQLASPLLLVPGQDEEYDHLHNGAPLTVIRVAVA